MEVFITNPPTSRTGHLFIEKSAQFLDAIAYWIYGYTAKDGAIIAKRNKACGD